MKILSTFAGVLFPLLSFAGGGQLGNGADAIVCNVGYQTTVELLDIYEARILFNKNWGFDYRGGTEKEASALLGANKILAPLDAKLPVKSARLRKYLNSFFDEAVFLSGIELTDIPDSLQLALPGGCKLAQLVIQSPDSRLGQKRYAINGDLWKLMDSTSQMGMMLHEIIYRDQIDLGHTDSRWTRYFNALLFSNSIDSMTPQQINDILRRGSGESFVHNGFELLGKSSQDQDVYQVVKASSPKLPSDIIEGRYNLKEDRLLDYTTSGKGEVLGLSTDKGYGVELSDQGKVSKAYLVSAKISESISISRKGYSDFGFYGIIVNGVDPSGVYSFEQGTAKASIKFKNGVTVNTWSLKTIQRDATLEDWLRSQNCNGGDCSLTIESVVFANGNDNVLGQIHLKYTNGDVLAIQSTSPTDVWIKNQVPNGTDPADAQFTHLFSPQKITFKSDGGFSFDEALWQGNGPVKLIMKDGYVVEVPNQVLYHFEFDGGGYLLRANPAP
jgi:hypothetical protein